MLPDDESTRLLDEEMFGWTVGQKQVEWDYLMSSSRWRGRRSLSRKFWENGVIGGHHYDKFCFASCPNSLSVKAWSGCQARRHHFLWWFHPGSAGYRPPLWQFFARPQKGPEQSEIHTSFHHHHRNRPVRHSLLFCATLYNTLLTITAVRNQSLHSHPVIDFHPTRSDLFRS